MEEGYVRLVPSDDLHGPIVVLQRLIERQIAALDFAVARCRLQLQHFEQARLTTNLPTATSSLGVNAVVDMVEDKYVVVDLVVNGLMVYLW